MAIKMSNEILSNPNSFDARLFVKVLSSLRLTSTNENVLKDLKVLCRRMLKVILAGQYLLVDVDLSFSVFCVCY